VEEGDGDPGATSVREVTGRFITLAFEIVDKRPMFPKAPKRPAGAEGKEGVPEEGDDDDQTREGRGGSGDFEGGDGRRSYEVTVSLGSNNVAPLWREAFAEPGFYAVEVELPRPMVATLHVLAVNDHGQAAKATVTVAYNAHLYGRLAWLASLPLLLVALPLLLAGGGTPAGLGGKGRGGGGSGVPLSELPS